LQIRARHAVAAATSQPSTSYQPTPGVEGKWVAEEEFYGASDITIADPDGDHSWWDEDDESEVEENIYQSEGDLTTPTISEKKRRRWRRNKRSDRQQSKKDQSSPSLKQPDSDTKKDNQPSSQYDEEHPMRTDEWALDIRLSRLFAQEGDELFPECSTDRDGRSISKPSKKNRYRKRQVMTFATNGYVKVSVTDDDNNNGNDDRIDNTSSMIQNLRNKPRVGRWGIGHSGVAFDIPVQMSASRKTRGNDNKVKEPKMTVLHYHADIHLNKFGERPRMFRGVITRDR